MKVFKFLLILLAVLALLSFACKPKEKVEEPVQEETENPIDNWTTEVKAMVEKWEAKVAEGKLTDADLDEYVKEKQALMEQAQGLDLEANTTEEQKPKVMELMQMMDKLDTESIPAAMKK